MMDDERFTQDAIDRLTPVEPSAQLRRMVAQIPIEHSRTEKSWWPFGSLWVPSFSLAAVAALGLYVGQGWAELRQNYEAESSTSPLAAASDESDTSQSEGPESSPSDELDDLLILATAGDFSPQDWDLSQVRLNDEPEEGTF